MKSDDKERWIRPFDKGSILDFYLTEYEDFDEFFEIVDVEEPSKTTNDGKFAAACIAQKIGKGESFNYEEAHAKVGIKQPFETYIENYKYFPYLETYLKKKFADKNVVLQSDVELAQRLIIKLVNSRINHCKYFVFIKNVYETYGQCEIYGTYNGCPCKIKVDRIIIDYINKTVQLVDIKSMGDYSSNFEQNFKYFSYNIQADFYWMIFNEMNWSSPNFDKSMIEGFTLLKDFLFLVIPTNESSCLDYKYRVCEENTDILTAIEMYKKMDEAGVAKTKQKYYELINEEVEIELNTKC